MTKLAELLERRTAAFQRMQENQEAGGEAFDTAEGEVRSLDDQIKRRRAVDDADRADPGTPLRGDPAPEIRHQSLAETIRYAMGAPCDRAKVEREQAFLEERAGDKAKGLYIATELFETRAAQTTATSAAIVPTDFRPELFTSALTASTVMQTMGATVLTGLTGNVVIPRETGSPNVGWVNEDQALPIGNATFDSLTLSPKHVGAIAELSRQLIMQASPAADGILRQMLSRNIALEIDRAAIAGTGADAQPTGILNTAGIPTVPFETDLFITTANMIGRADLANVAASRGFVTTNGVKAAAAKLRTSDGLPIPISATFHDEPVQFSNQVPSNLAPNANKQGLVYGDWADFLIGIWSQLDILVNPYAETAYSKGNILVRAMATVDFGVRRPASFVKATGVTA